MTGPTSGASPDQPENPWSRRRFLTGLGVGAVAAAGAAGYIATRDGSTDSPAPGTTSGSEPEPTVGTGASPTATSGDQPVAPTPVSTDRILVIIDQQGGADGLSTLIPYTDGRYYDGRPRLGVPPEQVLVLDGEVGLNPSLERLHQRGVTTVEGVGPVAGNLSHFAMQRRWHEGDVTGTRGFSTGFLARITDAIEVAPGGFAGLAVGGATPYFSNGTGANLVMNSIGDLDLLATSTWWEGPGAFPSGLAGFAPGSDLVGRAGASCHTLLELAETLVDRSVLLGGGGEGWITEAGPFGQRMATAADLVAADVGVRVVYVPLSGWDTHQGHEFAHGDLLRVIDVAVDGFLARMEAAGMADRVLVATTTEFGRRVVENGSGFDHGVATSLLLFGQGDRGRHGERPSLSDTDADGNLRTTVPFDRYLATLVQEWLGLDAERIVGVPVEPLGVFA